MHPSCELAKANIERVSKSARLASFDFETHLIRPGMLTPKPVCGSTAGVNFPARLELAPQALATLKKYLGDEEQFIAGANFVFDLGVACAQDATFVPLAFKALEEGRVLDTHILEALHDNGIGRLFLDENDKPFKRYSLEMCARRHLGVDLSAEKHGENAWRLRYAELDGVPLEEWPQEAKDYPLTDANVTLDVVLRQLAADRHNRHCYVAEQRAAWFLHLACIYGLRTDAGLVSTTCARIEKEHLSSRLYFYEKGLVTARAVKPKGGGLEDSDVPEEAFEQLAKQAEKMTPRQSEDWKGVLRWRAKGRGARFAVDGDALKTRVEAAYGTAVPYTSPSSKFPSGQVSTSRVTCAESGDELLEAYAEASENEKLHVAFVGLIQRGTSAPISPEANTFVATGRTSYREPNLQQLPRKGGIRETFVPREGRVYVSVDYGNLEMCSLAEVTETIVGYSRMADALRAGQDLHVKFAARLLGGISYEEACRRIKVDKEPLAVALRQSAKPVNFGLPGGMGALTLTWSALGDKGAKTVCPDGTTHPGVRFCVLAQVEARCGRELLTEWEGRDGVRKIRPTCAACVGLARQYIKLWKEEYPEVAEYHALIAQRIEEGDGRASFESLGLELLRGECTYSEGANFYFQNLAGAGAKRAGWLLAQECYARPDSILYGNCNVGVFVHDENIAEVREDVLHEAAYRMADVMKEGMREFIHRVPVVAEPAAMRRWFKAAETCKGKDGKLKPWWPNDWMWGPDQEVMRKDLER